MAKTPDEIKKGLECCADGNIVCAGNCAFDDDIKLGFPDCVKLLMTNALVLIQQLQAENAEKDERIKQLEEERDAAVRDLTEMAQDTDESCEYCEMFKTPHCSLECRMKNKGFKWSGVQKEE